MGKILFNEDPNHFVYTRCRAGYTQVTRAEAEAFIDQYRDTGITDFFVCLNASSNWYQSPETQNVLDKYRAWVKAGKIEQDNNEASHAVALCASLLSDFYDREGVDLQQVWIDRLRADGIRPWASFRMNDIHNGAEKGAFLHCDFYDDHFAQYGRAAYRGPCSYYDYALDYMHEPVRAHYKQVVREGLLHFDVDGVEFDWMREIYSVAIGREQEALTVLTAFMEELYGVVSEAEEKWGHPIRIGVRLPDTPEKCLRLGFDVFKWINSGRIDLITITSRWSSIDTDMPVDLWKQLLAGRPIELAAGLEILLDAYNRPGRRYRCNTDETALGAAYAYLNMGADAVYLFNYMDAVQPDPEQFYSDSVRYQRFLHLAGNAAEMANVPRRHVVTYDDVNAPGASGARQLPMQLSSTDIGPAEYRALRIPTGALLPGQRMTLVIGIERGLGTDATALRVYANTVACRACGQVATPEMAYDDMDYYAFELPAVEMKPTVMIAEVGITAGSARIHWVELDVKPAK